MNDINAQELELRYKTQVAAVNIRHFLNESLLLDGGHIGDGGRLNPTTNFAALDKDEIIGTHRRII